MAQISAPLEVPLVTAASVGSRSGAVARVVLASVLAAAGVIHLAIAPAHYGVLAAEGIGFAVVGWLQLVLGVVVVLRSRRWAVAAAVAVCTLAIVAWVWSRAFGFPIGPSAHVAEAAGLLDVATVVFEGLAVGVGGALLARRLSPGNGVTGAGAVGSLVPLATIVATTVLLVSPNAHEHVSTGHVHAATADAAATPDTAAHDHGSTTGATATGASATSVATAPWLDGSGTSDSTVVAAAGTDGATATTAHSHSSTEGTVAPVAAPAAEAAGQPTATPVADDKGFSLVMNGHQHDAAPVPLDPQTTAQLARQLARTAELVAAYPTVADAEAAGYHRNGPFSPGLGTHYGKGAGTIVGSVIDDQNVLDPMLIYNGTEPTSPLVGFMYIAPGSDAPPEGFAGPNDVWHYHTNVCLVVGADGTIDAPLGADHDNVDEALCKDQYGGFLIANTGYMLHVWTVPGWENPLGPFHETHPGITCADGTYWRKPDAEIGFALSTCKDA